MIAFLGRFTNFFSNKSKNLTFVFFALFITCFLAYGLSLDMYFWKDDFALMIKAKNPEESVGFFGPGIKGDGAYRYITIPFALLYPYFQLNAWMYFFIGIFLYFIASVGVFLLAREIFEDRLKGFLAGLIFSSGFIGADSIFGLTNSYQTSWVIFFFAICLLLFIKSFRKKNIGLYILSLFIFTLSLETGYIRAHGFFLILLSTAFLVVDKLSIKKITQFVFKIIPFFLIFKSFYLMSAPAQVGSSQLTQSLQSGNYNYFFNPVITFINVILPTSFISWMQEFLKIGPVRFQLILFILFGISLTLLIGFYYLKGFFGKKFNENRSNLRIILFALATIVGSFIGVFYIGAASTYLESTHRYLSIALIGLGLFWVSLFGLLFKRNKMGKMLSVLLICLTYLVMGNMVALQHINTRTTPQKEFFYKLKRFLPIIKNNTFINFEVSNKNNSNGKFGNIFGAGSVGGSPEITLHYEDVDRYDAVTTFGNFQDFVKVYKKENGRIENTHWFYFENNNLINKTKEFREILEGGRETDIALNKIIHDTRLVKIQDNYSIENTSFEIYFPNPPLSITDGLLKFKLKIIPTTITESSENNLGDNAYLEYLLSKEKIKRVSKTVVLNHYQNQGPENLFDGKIETTWMADRGPWHNLTNGVTDQIQFINITLDGPIELGGILFTNGHSLRTPIEYRIMINKNGNWEEVKAVSGYTEKISNEIWFEKLDPIITDSVRIELQQSSSGDAPQLAELELVERKYADLDFKRAQLIELDPSILLKQNPNSSLVKDYFGQNGKLSLTYLSNKDDDYNVPFINFSIKGFDQTYTYEIPIPANGIHLIKGKLFNLNFPAQYIFSNFEFINPPLEYFLKENDS